MAEYLQILDVRQAPSRLATEQVQAVYDLSRPPAATPGAGDGEWFDNYFGPYVGPVGENEIICTLVAGDGVTAWRVDSIQIELEFTTVGLATMDNNVLSLELRFRYAGGDPGYVPILKEQLWVVIQDFGGSTNTTYQRRYYWSLAGGVCNEYFTGSGNQRGWNGRVPPVVGGFGEGNLNLEVHIRDEGGPLGVVGFPADTVLRTTVTGRKSANGIMPVL